MSWLLLGFMLYVRKKYLLNHININFTRNFKFFCYIIIINFFVDNLLKFLLLVCLFDCQ